MSDIIELEGLEFFAYHGFYDEEQKLGNRYSIDIRVEVNLQKAAESDVLADTVSYEQLYKIAASAMREPARLLETVAQRIISATYEQYPHIAACAVSVSKHNPPLGGVCAKARVTLRR